uniref:Methyltransferase FkbM domain-containing protein n=1 Tax=Panagrolaimus davidi TaxID=227884 RepID=A0A914PUH7_9BILA
MSMAQTLVNRSKIIGAALIILILGYFYAVHSSPPISLFDDARLCLSDAFETATLKNFKTEWSNLNITVNKCTQKLIQSLILTELPNGDETKLAILPKYAESTCNVITLGIGKDIKSEKRLSQKHNQCTFLGIDPDAKVSGNLYITDLKGVYVQGVIGANGSIKAVPTENGAPLYPNFSFQNFISNYYSHETLDILLMDIESDEWALMKELINYPDKYPIICQINVEYHDPETVHEFSFFEDIRRSLQYGPYAPIRVETLKELSYNRIFFCSVH